MAIADTQPDFQTISTKLREPRHGILVAFLEADADVLNTAQIRDRPLVPGGSTTIHHLEKLVDWGLVAEEDYREYHGRGGEDARVWRLTDDGKAFCGEYVDEPVAAFVTPEEVTQLRDRVADLEEKFEAMQYILAKNGRELGTIPEEKATEWLNERA